MTPDVNTLYYTFSTVAQTLGTAFGVLAATIGVTGFEPATSWSRTKRSTKLSYTPGVPPTVNRAGGTAYANHLDDSRRTQVNAGPERPGA